MDRLVGKSNLFEMDLLLDINSEVYPIKQGEEIALMLTKYVEGCGVGLPACLPALRLI